MSIIFLIVSGLLNTFTPSQAPAPAPSPQQSSAVAPAALGSYPITGDTTVLDLIVATGGSLSNANLADVQIIRTAKGEQPRVNLLNVLLGIDKTRQKLEPGDLVFDPSVLTVSNKIFFIAEGRSATVLQVAEKINLLEALARANVVGPNVEQHINSVVLGIIPHLDKEDIKDRMRVDKGPSLSAEEMDLSPAWLPISTRKLSVPKLIERCVRTLPASCQGQVRRFSWSAVR
jgi:hypothetical protein